MFSGAAPLGQQSGGITSLLSPAEPPAAIKLLSPAAAFRLWQAGRYDAAQKVAMGHMTDAEIELLYTRRARELEAQQRLREAER